MENVQDIAGKRVPFNYMQFIGILFFVISSTFTLASIYFRFQSGEGEIIKLKKEIEYTNTRIDKKTARNATAIKEIKEKLEKSK